MRVDPCGVSDALIEQEKESARYSGGRRGEGGIEVGIERPLRSVVHHETVLVVLVVTLIAN